MKKTTAHRETTRRITVGSVTVECREPSPAEVARNVRAGQLALKRGLAAMHTPGVTLDLPKHLPRYRADPASSEHVIRVLNGVEERGTFVGGTFRICPK